jgi:hypothetical protein
MTEENLKVGDVFLITDTNNKRNDWPLGKLLKCYPREYEIVCAVDVQTRNGVFKRPVNRVAHVHRDEMTEESMDNEVSTLGIISSRRPLKLVFNTGFARLYFP